MNDDKRQLELRIMGCVTSDLEIFPDEYMQYAKTYLEARRLTVKLSKKPRKAIERECDLTTSHMSRILEGSRNLPQRCEFSFYRACGNIYDLQWQLWRMGISLNRREPTGEEKAKAEAEHWKQKAQERGAA